MKDTLLRRLQRQVEEALDAGQEVPLPGLFLLRYEAPTALECTVYEPMVCLILQGRKEVQIGACQLSFGGGEALLVSHLLPVVSQVVEACNARPYVALVFSLDVALLRSLYDEVADVLVHEDAQSVQLGAAPDVLVEAWSRYLALRCQPLAARVLGDSVRRELHFHLLMSQAGGMLRELLRHDSHGSQIARAIATLRREYTAPLDVSALAHSVGMSTSSFHQHFKAITATSPLQYQKALRLLEARRLLKNEGMTVAAAAFAVGYESATQFSREYSRKFQHPPRETRNDSVAPA